MSQACLSCGACCATFRVSFYWAETDAHPNGHVPAEQTVAISPYHVAMRGTQQPQPRCIALQGEIGQCVSCAIYAQRSSTCRDFRAGDTPCQQARAQHGLPPLPARLATTPDNSLRSMTRTQPSCQKQWHERAP